ncbi:MAG: DUF2795 domain-containing protein [Desulfomonilia bacterium]|jgi:hypothetical protein|nr:DUF2795 domain-containing protein [Pseudomonadota bacterium]HON39676.1 DUF2795 domain-containing protein [Deltaproteobacteria bacterium]HRS55386.1 DUF2795 domain-containing protein [Desulfomonilia bacterium]HPD20455.1 DUF2795 domain-containing protein [Deltaproteobacteria bacterium]HPX18872.1 DUF2795 domain-containing protein [Deltaproteobacteria bacterium]
MEVWKMVSAADVLEAIKGIDLPKSKSELVDYARSRNVPQDVIDVLNRLPDRRYRTASDITQAMGDIE